MGLKLWSEAESTKMRESGLCFYFLGCGVTLAAPSWWSQSVLVLFPNGCLFICPLHKWNTFGKVKSSYTNTWLVGLDYELKGVLDCTYA